jgi:hypothetical protein
MQFPDTWFEDIIGLQIERLAKAIVQTYRVADAFRLGLWKPDTDSCSRISGSILVTLENWFLLGPAHKRFLNELVEAKLAEAGIGRSVLDQQPYAIVRSADLPRFLHLASKSGICTLLSEMNDQKFAEWDTAGILNELSGNNEAETQRIFDKDYEEYFSRMKMNFGEP